MWAKPTKRLVPRIEFPDQRGCWPEAPGDGEFPESPVHGERGCIPEPLPRSGKRPVNPRRR